MKKSIYKNISIIITLVMYINTQAQPGTLDTRFGNQGKIFENDFRAAADVLAIQKDGKIIAAGNYHNGGGTHISRYNDDGTLDVTFGNEGRQLLTLSAGYNFYLTQDMLLQPDGKIIIGVRTSISTPDKDVSLIRLNNNGSLDNSFGNNGIVNLAIGPNDDLLGEIALQEDGKIVVAGLRDVGDWSNYENEEPFILRLNTDGSYDATFGENGRVIQNFNGKYVRINALLILPDGKIITGGEEDDEFYDNQVAIFKYNSNGTLDTLFGNKGIAESRLPKDIYGHNIVGSVNDILFTPNGQLFVAGTTAYSYLFIAKFTSIGEIDSSFAVKKGYAVFTGYPKYSYGLKSFTTKGNKILVTGTYSNNGFAAYRFLNDGSLDSTFGESGVAVHYFDIPSNMGLRGAAIQSDGKIILAGSGANRNDDYSHICMLRLHGDGGITPENYVKIKRWMKKNGFTWPGAFMQKNASYTIERSTDKLHFTAIASVNKTAANSNEYAFEDVSPAKGNNYYRVVYKDEKGKIMYSNTIVIENNAAIDIYPNPAANELNIRGLQQKTWLSIQDINGDIKMSREVSGSNYILNITGLPKGHYFLCMSMYGAETVVKKFYKQ